MYDLFHNRASGLESPATRLASVTPNDTADLAFATRAIAVGEDFRAGRWWWEDEAAKECGLHVHEEAGDLAPQHSIIGAHA